MKILVNEVMVDGFRRVVVGCDGLSPLAVVPRYCVDRAEVEVVPGAAGQFEVRWPVLGPVDFGGEGYRLRYFMVHRVYGVGVRDCVRLAVDGWRVGTREDALYGYVRQLPRGVENGFEVDGVMLFEADWMLRDCVAVR